MAIYKIFPSKDNFINSKYPTSNYGRDEVLDIASDTDSISRAIIQFPQSELTTLINSISGAYSASLKMYLANASTIPFDYNIEIYPLSHSWDMGTGRSGDEPNPKNGSCWNTYNSITSSIWSGGSYLNNVISQSFSYQDNKDINCNITPFITSWISGTYLNNGLLLKHTSAIESGSASLSTQFFSMDTHTVYPPHLEIAWNDVIFSSSLSVINSNNFVSNIVNNKEEFIENSIYTFKIKNRDVYPARSFQTSSIYLDNKILPSSSFWSLKDMKTEEVVIDYNNLGTKIGANNEGNYFTIYMNGLQPERYYQIILKTTIGDNTIIIDNPNNFFKVTR